MIKQQRVDKPNDSQVSARIFFLSICWLFFSPSTLSNSLPDFASYKSLQEKKQAFFNFLFPIIVEENRLLLNTRNKLKALEHNYPVKALSPHETHWLANLKADYFIESNDFDIVISSLLKQIDVIPPSLILAQAAIESGWGTSRFARKGNNLFGHWCFIKGCGLVPLKRDHDKAHEVASYNSINESVRSYLKNLNSFHRYAHFRTLRSASSFKKTGQGALSLLPGLKAYSEQGNLYILKVSNLIKHNELEKYDRLFFVQLRSK